MQTRASLFCFAADARWEIKDSTNSRVAPLRVCVPQKSAAYSLHEIGIEVVLADQKAELIPEAGLAVGRAVGGGKCPFDGGAATEDLGALENAPNSSTEQRPIP